MSDSFADLWTSTAPISKPAPTPKKLGSTTPQIAPRRPQYDAFAILASSAPNSRPRTPASTTPASAKPAPSNGNGDPFGGLLSGSLASTNNANMTIAERAALAEKEKLASLQRRNYAVKKETAAWDGLDSLGAVKPTLPSSTTHDDDWGFGQAAQSKSSNSKPSIPPAVADDDWGLHGFSSQPSQPSSSTSKSPSPSSSSQAIWDLDGFASPPLVPSSSQSKQLQRSDSPSADFDFGNGEDRGGLLDDDSHDEDDILGDLSKPVDAIPKRSPPTDRVTQATPSPRPTSRASSPPPHIVGQIVEMGFSPQQARVALAATETGLDVQAALETLLSNTASSSTLPPRERERPSDEIDPDSRRRNPNRPPRQSVSREAAPSPANSLSQQQQLQEQADKLLAQASEIGLSVLSKANAFWNTGKEKALKAYEERAKAAATSTGASGSSNNGRPKWMQDIPADHDNGDEGGATRRKDQDVPPPMPARRHTKPDPPSQDTKPQTATADLFSDAPSVYISPFRRGRPQPAAASPSPTPRTPSPAVLVQRNTVIASSAAITNSTHHKNLGTEKYKLGQYSEAETAYTRAIETLPDGHLLLIPLYNNRALTRLKTGDYGGAIEDSAVVITIIGTSYHPAREAKVTSEQEGASVDLGDGLVKAWKRRAEAWEGKEKWEEAGKDWEAVAGCPWTSGNVKSDGVRGAGRCRRMAGARHSEELASPPPSIKPKPKPKPASLRQPIRRGPTPPSEALNKLREANNAQEVEDQARHDLKDTVDARLLAWKGGKETNLRALIASLDTVLWSELGWVKVGMGELVSPGQVKVRYTRAIAKVHPDKLNTGNTTLEQRMIANGVFGALNEAWVAFKQ